MKTSGVWWQAMVLWSLGMAAAPAQSESQASPGTDITLAPLRVDGAFQSEALGVWRSRGYGWLLHIQADSLALYDERETGTLRSDEGWEGTLAAEGWIHVDGDRMTLAASAGPATRYTFDRLDGLPRGYDLPPSDDPEAIFEDVWELMRAHYAFFELHGVDWDARYDALADRAAQVEGDEALLALLGDLLTGLNDDHLMLTAEIDGEERTLTHGQPRVLWPALDAERIRRNEGTSFDDMRRWWMRHYRGNIGDRLLGGEVQEAAGGRLVWGSVGNVGYLNLLAMGGFSNADDTATELLAVHETFDRLLTDLAECDALIFDITRNSGGYDEVQMAIVSHFCAEPTHGFSKVAFDAPNTVPQHFMIPPADGVRWLKPVALVTSDYTVSAGEDFTLAMRELPQVTHWGMTTRGAFSDMLEKRLANGWLITLSNERYLDVQGVCWEALGVPPEKPLAVFDPARIETSHVEAMERLAARLAK